LTKYHHFLTVVKKRLQFFFKDKSRVPLHKIRVRKKDDCGHGERYEVEYFGL